MQVCIRRSRRHGKASELTNMRQGGPFTPEQVTKFEKNPFFREAVNVRIYDDKAKVVDYNTRTLESFKPIVQRVLAAHAWI
jgi:predicted HD phosphohydrolase